MTGPLHNLTVLEMAGLGPCPLAGQLLADLGASVIVIDRKSGEDFSGDINRRGKKSIALNLKSPSGCSALSKLVSEFDILIEGYRPGVMERLGFGPDECSKLNPHLIFGRMTGWGQTGPLAKTAGHDINYLGLTGALNAMGEAGRPPVPPLNFVADYAGGTMFLIMGILAAVYERQSSGKGQVVDAAMIDGVPAMMGIFYSLMNAGKWTNDRGANWLDGGAPYYRCYKTADEKFVSVGPLEPQFFAEMIEIMGLDPALNQTRNDPKNWLSITEKFEEIFAGKPRDEWAQIFDGSDACVFPVLDFDEASIHPQNESRDIFRDSNGLRQAHTAPRFSRCKPDMPKAGCISGVHNHEIMRGAGFSESDIAAMEADGSFS